MSLWVWGFLIVTGCMFAAKMAYVAATGWSLPKTQGALFTSTSSIRIHALLDIMPMKAHDLFVDLGCGDGRVLRAARDRYGVQAWGFEINLWAFLLARIRTLGYKGIRIRCEDFWKVDLKPADVVFCYLFPDVMERMAAKLEKELRPGAKVVSCNFPFPGWRPRKVFRPTRNRHGDPIYIYIMELK